MHLKRIFEPVDLARYLAEVDKLVLGGMKREEAQRSIRQPKVTHHELYHAGTTPEQNFSTSLITRWLQDGCATLSGDQLLLKTDVGDLRFTVLRRPGFYCCHNDERMVLSEEAYGDAALSAIEARAWLEEKGFLGKESPDPCNPAGYRRSHQFDCVLDAEQHAKFKVVPGPLAFSSRAADRVEG